MNQMAVEFTGKFIKEFQEFAEDQIAEKDSPYSTVELEETREYGDGKRAGVVTVVLLTLHIALDLTKDLFKAFLQDQFNKNNHSATFTIKNDKGEELTIALNKLNMAEIKALIDDFRGNITSIESK